MNALERHVCQLPAQLKPHATALACGASSCTCREGVLLKYVQQTAVSSALLAPVSGISPPQGSGHRSSAFVGIFTSIRYKAARMCWVLCMSCTAWLNGWTWHRVPPCLRLLPRWDESYLQPLGPTMTGPGSINHSSQMLSHNRKPPS